MNNLRKVKLDDLVYEVSERVANPSESGYERFIGLEHLDSGSFYVNRWGNTNDVKSAMKLFKKGDILFARRNTYLKRVSVADFDGVCSGDIIVLREYETSTKGITLLLMNLEKFWEFAISNSAGTMSKRAKWRDIKYFEVYMPNEEKQSQIVGLMHKIECIRDQKNNLMKKTKIYRQKLLDKIIFNGIRYDEMIKSELKYKYKIYSIKEMIENEIIDKPLDGNHGAIHPTVKDYVNEGIPFIMANDIKDRELDLINCSFITEELSKKLKKGFAKAGDVLITHKGSIGNTALVPKIESEYIVLTPQVTYYRVLNSKVLLNKYLKYYFETRQFQRQFSKLASGGTRPYLGIIGQQKLNVLLPPIDQQHKIVEILECIDSVIDDINKSINSIDKMRMSILNKLL